MGFNFNPSSWFNNAFYRRVEGNYVYSLTNPGGLGEWQSVFNGGYSEANMMLLFQTIPEFFFPVNAIASRVMQGQYKLIDKDGEEVADNKLWNKMLLGPDWTYSFDGFLWHAVAHRLITGNRYGYAHIPSTMRPKHDNIQALWLLPPHYTYPHLKAPRPSYLTTTAANQYIDYYQYNGGGDTMSQIPVDLVTHDVYMKLGDATDIVTWRGVSPFKAGEYPLSNIAAVYKARNAIYVKGGPMGAIVSAVRDSGGSVAWTDTEKEEVIRDINTRHGFGPGQSPFAVTNQPLSYVKMGATINELEPFRETEASAAALCGIVGVPVALMPKGTDAKYSNLDISERNLYENVIFAEGESICKFLTKLCRFDELGYSVVVSFDHVTCLQDDALKFAQAFKANAEAAQKLYDGGHITQNELRVRCGLDPIEGGDIYASEADVTVQENPEQVTGGEGGKGAKAKGRITKHKLKKLNHYSHVVTSQDRG